MTVKVKLEKPVTHDGKTHGELEFNEPIVEHLFAMDAVKGDARKSAALLAAMAGVPLPVIGKLSFKDLARVNEATAAMMAEVIGAMGDGGKPAAEAGGEPASA